MEVEGSILLYISLQKSKVALVVTSIQGHIGSDVAILVVPLSSKPRPP